MRTSVLFMLLSLPAALAEPRLLLYAPFDGTLQPIVAGGDAAPVHGDLAFVEGRNGAAVNLQGDLRYSSAGNIAAAAGTFAAWVRLTRDTEPRIRYLFCVYGDPAAPEPWRHHRFSLTIAGAELHWTVWDSAGRTSGAVGSLADWSEDAWHHVAVTWTGIGGGDGTAAYRLYLDGRLIARADGLTVPFETLGPTLDIGRDSDGSPDYLDGLLDELYIYDAPLDEAIIAAAAGAPAEQTVTDIVEAVGGPRDGWWHTGWAYRYTVELPAGPRDRTDFVAALPVSVTGETRQLSGRPEAPIENSFRVLAEGGSEPLPSRVDGGSLLWPVAGTVPAGQTRRFYVYVATTPYDLSIPLQARRPAVRLAAPPATFELPDYATVAYGDAWDFDEGDDEEIDQWGNKPELIRDRSVHDGAIHFEVAEDPFFIWGNMWGQVAQSKRPVDIDLDHYTTLEIRLRQSVSSATWSIYGRRAGSEQLISYDFDVTGTGWQTVRVDLARQARWRGRISAFRIDPTNRIEATVAIDWVRLLALAEARVVSIETIGHPSGVPASLRVDVPPAVVAGETAVVVATVTDAAGRPVAGQPLTVALEPGSGGALAAAPDAPSWGGDQWRRGLSNERGEVRVALHVARRAGPGADRLRATADFTAIAAQTAVVDSVAGGPDHLAISPHRATALPPGETTVELVAQVVDRWDNPLPVAGRPITLTASEGATISPSQGVSGPEGAFRAKLTIDPARRWVANVNAVAGELQGRSGAICYTPDRRDWGVEIGENGYFRTPDGRGWLPLGGFYANWVGDVPAEGEPGRRLISFVDASEEQKVAWLRYLSRQGVTAMRFMLRAHRAGGLEPMDIGGKVNPELYAEALAYMDLARPFGIRFLVVLHEDYTKPMYFNDDYRRRFCLPRWEGVDLALLTPAQRRFVVEGRLLETIDQKYTDPDAIACQDQYAREIVGLLKDNPQVFAYELENEMVAVPPEWIAHACEVIRSVDPHTPVAMSHGGGGLHTGDPMFWMRHGAIDFYTYHLYPRGTTGPDVDYGLLTDVLTSYGRMVGRCFLGESVGDEFARDCPEPDRRRVARDIIWFSIVNGNPGCMFWNQRGYEVEEYALARKITDAIDLARWRRAVAPAAVNVAHPLEGDRWYRTAEGGRAMAMMAAVARQHRRLGVGFEFCWEGGAPLDSAAPPAGPAPIAPPEGYEAASLVREDGSEGLTYLRNVAGVFEWRNEAAGIDRIWLRTVQARPLTLRLGLGEGRFELTVTDLDTGAEQRIERPGDGRVELGITDHDVAIHWRRR